MCSIGERKKGKRKTRGRRRDQDSETATKQQTAETPQHREILVEPSSQFIEGWLDDQARRPSRGVPVAEEPVRHRVPTDDWLNVQKEQLEEDFLCKHLGGFLGNDVFRKFFNKRTKGKSILFLDTASPDSEELAKILGDVYVNDLRQIIVDYMLDRNLDVGKMFGEAPASWQVANWKEFGPPLEPREPHPWTDQGLDPNFAPYRPEVSQPVEVSLPGNVSAEEGLKGVLEELWSEWKRSGALSVAAKYLNTQSPEAVFQSIWSLPDDLGEAIIAYKEPKRPGETDKKYSERLDKVKGFIGHSGHEIPTRSLDILGDIALILKLKKIGEGSRSNFVKGILDGFTVSLNVSKNILTVTEKSGVVGSAAGATALGAFVSALYLGRRGADTLRKVYRVAQVGSIPEDQDVARQVRSLTITRAGRSGVSAVGAGSAAFAAVLTVMSTGGVAVPILIGAAGAAGLWALYRKVRSKWAKYSGEQKINKDELAEAILEMQEEAGNLEASIRQNTGRQNDQEFQRYSALRDELKRIETMLHVGLSTGEGYLRETLRNKLRTWH